LIILFQIESALKPCRADGNQLGAEMDNKTHRHEIISVAVSTNVRGFETTVFDIITHGEDFAGMAVEHIFKIQHRGFMIMNAKRMWLW